MQSLCWTLSSIGEYCMFDNKKILLKYVDKIFQRVSNINHLCRSRSYKIKRFFRKIGETDFSSFRRSRTDYFRFSD